MNVTDPIALQHHQALTHHIKDVMGQSSHQCISFAEFMQLALYAPGLGYYSAGSHKLGKQGDFITAPVLSDLFSYTLANQCAEILRSLNNGDILEFGAGTGQMAAAILEKLKELNTLPQYYFILEISADLRERQQKYLRERHPDFFSHIIWLSELPKTFSGVMLANEVLDATPVHLFEYTQNTLQELYDSYRYDEFIWQHKEPSQALTKLFQALEEVSHQWQTPYLSEVNALLPGWMKSVANSLEQGVLLLIDYGFPRHEYYAPSRKMGTLMCHYQQQAHTDPLVLCGLQDITAHVDFTSVVEHGVQAGFTLEGFTNQANFLLNCNMASLLEQNASLENTQAFKMLTLPSEMGEIFKVMGLSKNYAHPLLGFSHGDQSHRL